MAARFSHGQAVRIFPADDAVRSARYPRLLKHAGKTGRIADWFATADGYVYTVVLDGRGGELRHLPEDALLEI
jgi:hypothetical protein